MNYLTLQVQKSGCNGSEDSAQTQAQQVSTLLHCLGEEAELVLASTHATEEEKADYREISDTFFKVQNVIFERARFNQRHQLVGESVVELYKLAENCDYEDMGDEMIQDRLVMWI